MFKAAPTMMAVATALLMLCLPPSIGAEEPRSVIIGERQWAVATNGADLPWSDAERHCGELDLDGRQDWRLPDLAELQALHDPIADGGVPAAIELDTCCIWSRTTLAEHPADAGGDSAGPPSQYFWGLIFETGTAYYSFQRFADGRALCVSDGEGLHHQ